MERHWQLVTRRLSAAVTADIAALDRHLQSYPQDAEAADADPHRLRPAPARRGHPPRHRPAAAGPEALLLDPRRDAVERTARARSTGPTGSTRSGARTSSRSASSSTTAVMRVLARRIQAYASNSHIFLVWMGGSSADPARHRDPVPAQPDPADPAPGGRGGRASARGARSSSARAARAKCAKPATPSSR